MTGPEALEVYWAVHGVPCFFAQTLILTEIVGSTILLVFSLTVTATGCLRELQKCHAVGTSCVFSCQVPSWPSIVFGEWDLNPEIKNFVSLRFFCELLTVVNCWVVGICKNTPVFLPLHSPQLASFGSSDSDCGRFAYLLQLQMFPLSQAFFWCCCPVCHLFFLFPLDCCPVLISTVTVVASAIAELFRSQLECYFPFAAAFMENISGLDWQGARSKQ